MHVSESIYVPTQVHQDGVLLGGELLQQVLVGRVGGGVLARGRPVPQAMLMGEEEPHLPAFALRNAWTSGNGCEHSIRGKRLVCSQGHNTMQARQHNDNNTTKHRGISDGRSGYSAMTVCH